MSDLAGSLFMMGMIDSARDAYLVSSMTARYQWVRWQSTINLMELASFEGNAESFDRYGRELRNAALDPRLRSYFLLFYGEGSLRLGRHDEGLRSIAEAKEFAAAHKIFQLAHDAEKALVTGEKVLRLGNAASEWTAQAIPDEVAQVASALSDLRDSALTSPPLDEWP